MTKRREYPLLIAYAGGAGERCRSARPDRSRPAKRSLFTLVIAARQLARPHALSWHTIWVAKGHMLAPVLRNETGLVAAFCRNQPGDSYLCHADQGPASPGSRPPLRPRSTSYSESAERNC